MGSGHIQGVRGQAPVDVPIVIWQDDDPEAQLVCFEKTMGTFGAHH